MTLALTFTEAFELLYITCIIAFLLCAAMSFTAKDSEEEEFWEYLGIILIVWPAAIPLCITFGCTYGAGTILRLLFKITRKTWQHYLQRQHS